MDPNSKRIIIENFRALFLKHGSGPDVGEWSPSGQRFRFEKLIEIGDLRGRRVLELGCGIADLYPFLLERFDTVDYTGIDIVPELIEHAAQNYPHAHFSCLDILEDNIDESFDYVLMSGVFNKLLPNSTSFLKPMITKAFRLCSVGLGFNFISTYVNFVDSGIAYHDPVEVLDYCLKNLTRRVILQHHYERCDVVVFAYR